MEEFIYFITKKWAIDPTGWLRHTLVGSIGFLALRLFLTPRQSLIGIIALSLLKEMYDLTYKTFFDPLDTSMDLITGIGSAYLTHLLFRSRKALKLLSLALLLIFVGCKKEPVTIDGYTPITIKKGEFDASPKWDPIDLEEPAFEWKFTESCRYYHNPDSTFSGDQKDHNMLFGHSWFIHSAYINSTRVGWRYNSRLELFEINTVSYVNEARQISGPMVYVDVDQVFRTFINRIGVNMIEIRVEVDRPNGEGIQQERVFWVEYQGQVLPHETLKVGTRFGGNRPATHDMTLLQKRID